MIRWRFVITRLLIVGAIVMLVRWGLGPVATYVTVSSIQSMTGAKVEIGQSEVGLFPPRIIYNDVAVANPSASKGMQNAFNADSMSFVIDGDSLLHRRLVISESKISGIKIGVKRDTNGHLPSEPEDELGSDDQGPSALERLLESLASSTEQQAEALLAEMQTKQVSEEIRIKWETEYRQLAQRAKDLEQKIRSIRDRTRDISNPLRDWPEVERALADATQAKNELLAVRTKLDSLPQQLQADFVRLDQAKQHDLRKLYELVPVDLSQGADVAGDMLVASVRGQLARVRGYLDSGRAIANYTVVAPKADRCRGESIDMYGGARQPSILVRSCEVGGVMRVDGDVYSLTGILENLTPTPELLTDPARARVRLEGPEIVRLDYVRDQRQGRDADVLTLHFPELGAKPMRIGNDHTLGLQVAGGQRELWVQIHNEHGKVQGRLVSKQSETNIDLLVDSKLEKYAAVESLRTSLAAVDRIEIDARFEGEWDDLDVNMTTNLSRVFKQATQDAVAQQVVETREKLTAKVAGFHQEKTAELRQWLTAQQNQALTLVATADKSIEEMRQKVLREAGSAENYLGKLRGTMQEKLR